MTSTGNSLVRLGGIVQASNELADEVLTELHYVCHPETSQGPELRWIWYGHTILSLRRSLEASVLEGLDDLTSECGSYTTQNREAEHICGASGDERVDLGVVGEADLIWCRLAGRCYMPRLERPTSTLMYATDQGYRQCLAVLSKSRDLDRRSSIVRRKRLLLRKRPDMHATNPGQRS